MSGERGNSAGRTPPDLQAALDRLEKAVQRFAAGARDEFVGRATSFINDAASKLEQELRGEGAEQGHRSSSRRARRESSRRRARQRRRDRRGSDRAAQARRPNDRKLYRDRERAKIAGVCAGISNYLGAEVWVVRCVAITGLIFIPGLTFPGYWILYFVMKPPPGREPRDAMPEEPADHTSPAPELGPRLSPRRSLRNLRADLARAELRLRRMESHVTSGQYELQKELHKLDDGGARAPG